MITERAKTIPNCAGVALYNRRVFVSPCTVLAQALYAVAFISCHFVTKAVLTNLKTYREDAEQLLERNQ